MRFLTVSLLLAALGMLANAQTVKHVIVVIQENRTPDNLFGADPALAAQGANLWGTSNPAPCVVNGISQPTVLQPYALDACFSPSHKHASWIQMYDQGKMDQACDVPVTNATCASQLTFPSYTYVDNSKQLVTPYFNIAANYGFANYMFQTNQGPSYPAHLFLFSGTSAPVDDDGDPNRYWQWFAGENPVDQQITGCVSPLGQVVEEIDPQGKESEGYTPPYPPGAGPGFPCYSHNTLADLLDNAGVSWKYYASAAAYSLWTAPSSIASICGTVVNGECTGDEFNTHVVAPSLPDQAPILTDIEKCNLAAVSWVIPDGRWSDHPGGVGDDGGPSWVATIVNAVGRSNAAGTTSCNYWSDTVILIVWDDWGGWFDHVSPAAAAGGPGIGYPNQTGGQNVYGFRVPLLVVSAYAKPGYISGPASNPDCSHGNYYCHDFGSILNFIEHTFNLGASGINPAYPYADTMAPDSPQVFPASPYSLADFFGTEFHAFVPVTGAKYPPSCFFNQSVCWTNGASDPDDDAADEQEPVGGR
ncbi:MAG: alkaline phosphatase family protein [Terriglobales bacterium]